MTMPAPGARARPELETERGPALRTLLYLFRRDEAVQYLRAANSRHTGK